MFVSNLAVDYGVRTTLFPEAEVNSLAPGELALLSLIAYWPHFEGLRQIPFRFWFLLSLISVYLRSRETQALVSFPRELSHVSHDRVKRSDPSTGSF